MMAGLLHLKALHTSTFNRLLIQVGLMKSFIRRLHKYPLLRKPDAELTELLADVQKYVDRVKCINVYKLRVYSETSLTRTSDIQFPHLPQ